MKLTCMLSWTPSLNTTINYEINPARAKLSSAVQVRPVREEDRLKGSATLETNNVLLG